MRIQYLINGFNGGGAALPIPDLVKLMHECGHAVKVCGLMLQDGKACDRLAAAGIAYEVLGKGKWSIAGSFHALIRSLKKETPDIIWTSLTRATLFGQIAGKMLGIPVVSWQHSAFLKPANRFLLRRTKNLSSRWVTDSENVREFAIRELGISHKKISIWPMFHTHPGFPKSQSWAGVGRIRIGSLGRLHTNKRFDTLIRVAARIQASHPEISARIEFLVGGVGPEKDALQSLLETLRVSNFCFVGYVDEPGDFLKNLHIYVQPSHHEGLCIAAHEAMQSALPVIATRVGQLRHSIIDGETGLLCDVDDVDALAAAVIALVRDPDKAGTMGVAAHRRVTELFGYETFQQSGKQLLHLLESGVGQQKN